MTSIEYENTTSSENLEGLNKEAATLTNEQILTAIWMFICLIPNILLIYIFVKNRLYTTNFYFTILNWCIANVLITCCLLYVYVVPTKYIAVYFLDELFYIYFILPTLTVILITLFMFKRFLHSKRFCTYFVYAFWCLFAISIVVEIACSVMERDYTTQIFYMVGPIKVFSIVVLMIKMAFDIVVPPAEDDENFLLRIVMVAAYVLLDFSVWFLQFVFIMDIIHSYAYKIAMYALYFDGYINLMLLIYCDCNVKYYFYGLFRRQRNEEEVSVHIIDVDDPLSKTAV